MKKIFTKVLATLIAIVFSAGIANAQCVVSSTDNPGPGIPLDQTSSGFQSFTATCSGALSSLELKIDVFMTLSGTVYVYAGVPTTFNSPLASQSFSVPSPATGVANNSIRVNFGSHPASVTSGNVYTFRVVNNGMDPAFLFASHTPAPGGSYQIDNASGRIRFLPFDFYYIANITPSGVSISGANGVCVGQSTVLTASVPGGTWSTTSVQATVDNAGNVTGRTAGTTTVKYIVGGQIATKTFTVGKLPAIPSIGGAGGQNPQAGAPSGSACRNRTFSLVGSPSGGEWSTTGGFTLNSASTANPASFTSAGVAGAASFSYTLTVDGCSNSRTFSMPIAACKGSHQAATTGAETFAVYPNPAHNVINIKVNNLTGAATAFVTDLYGKQIAKQAISRGNNTIDVSNFAKGMYFVSMVTEQGRQVEKIIVE